MNLNKERRNNMKWTTLKLHLKTVVPLQAERQSPRDPIMTKKQNPILQMN